MNLAENINLIQHRIITTAKLWGRDPKTIKLIAVSKNQPEESIRNALNAGLRIFGENRVQEAEKHWLPIKNLYPDLKLHLIGPLQTNKIEQAVRLFDSIETLDREKLAIKLGEEMKRQNRVIPCLIQINTGEEEQKSGIHPHHFSDFLVFCRKEVGLTISGLMTIPPLNEPPSLHFALLKKLAQKNNLEHISMGMSSDFEKAIALGATSIRIGTALFSKKTP